MDNTKFKYDMPNNRPIIDISCYPVNMVYDTGGRILNLVTDSTSKPMALEDDAIDADTPTIVVKKV